MACLLLGRVPPDSTGPARQLELPAVERHGLSQRRQWKHEAKAVSWHTKAVETRGKGGVLAHEGSESTQGKGGALLDEWSSGPKR